MGGSCSNNWYQVTYYDDETFALLQPKKMICYDEDSETVEETDSASTVEFKVLMMMQFYLGAIIVLFILYRSCSSVRTDGFRLVFLYMLGTIGTSIAVQFGAGTGGFHRVLGWGMMAHNLAEWFIISRIWFGEEIMTGLPALLYLMVFIVLITFLPLLPLFFIGMVQGGFCDYLLVFTMIYLMRWTKKYAESGRIESAQKYMMAGMWGAIFHIVTIQPLFYGMALAYSPLMYVTTIFLLPVMVLYAYWASSGVSKLNLVAPSTAVLDDDITKQTLLRYKLDVDVKQNVSAFSSDDEEAKELDTINNDEADDGQSKSNSNLTLYRDVLLDVLQKGLSSIDPNPSIIQRQRNLIFCGAFLAATILSSFRKQAQHENHKINQKSSYW